MTSVGDVLHAFADAVEGPTSEAEVAALLDAARAAGAEVELDDDLLRVKFRSGMLLFDLTEAVDPVVAGHLIAWLRRLLRADQDEGQRPVGVSFVGVGRSGRGDVSERHKELRREMLDAEHTDE